MSIPEVSREKIVEALQIFDRELRESQEWQGWEQRRSYKYAISHEGKLYPPKKIISLAAGINTRAFSGGRGKANKYLEERGFKVISLEEGIAKNQEGEDSLDKKEESSSDSQAETCPEEIEKEKEKESTHEAEAAMGETPGQDEATTKLLQIFKFLQGLDQLRNPVQRDINGQPWSLWFSRLPDHPAVEQGTIVESGSDDFAEEGDEDDENDEVEHSDAFNDAENVPEAKDFILKVKRPVLSDPPVPPEELLPWLQGNWKNINEEVTASERIVYYHDDGTPVEDFFDSDPRRPELLRQWLNRRKKWREKELPAYQAMEVFERLYELQARLEREGERFELMLGDGLLSWVRPDGNVLHPVHLQKVHLSFDPDRPEFTIREVEQSPPELYTAIFRAMPDVNAVAVSNCREELEQNIWHPLGGDNTSSFYKRLAVQIASQGKYVESFSENVEHPEIKREPVLFLRKRNLGFGIAIDNIIENLPECNALPPSLKNVVGIETQEEPAGASELESASPLQEEDENILLTRPANLEQIEIARRLEKRGAVLVQGPPGTGKTHTIGNLIGHLLAQGKSILVTSHTSKALSMVRQNVVEQLRPLCVSVLEDKSNPLKDSGETIIEKLSYYSGDELEREAARNKTERDDIIQKLRQARETLKQARQDEYRPVVFAGQEFNPSEAARFIADRREEHAWIPSPVEPEEPLPLTVSELMELYNSNKLVTGEEELELQYELPETSDITAPSDFKDIVNQLNLLEGEDLEARKDLWLSPSEGMPEQLQDLSEKLMEAIQPLFTETGWQLSALAGQETNA